MKDNFSQQAALYAKFRPKYPPKLYSYIFDRCLDFNIAWDCGTGNGQVATELSKIFNHVLATDISKSQLKHAEKRSNLHYSLNLAEDSKIESESIDLICVAQAIHWFDFDQFYREVQRVAKQTCLLAYWAYALPVIEPKLDAAIIHFHDSIVDAYWDKERGFWHQEYANIKYPLHRFERKDFTYTTKWRYEHLEGYLNSWSSVQHFIRKEKYNPTTEFLAPFKKDWAQPKVVDFPIFLYAGSVYGIT